MIKDLVTFCVKRSGSVVIVGLIVFGLGIYLLETARLDVFPEFAPPQVVIQTEAPGFSSEKSELLVTKPIEKSLAGLPGIEKIRSQSSPGLSVITAIFDESQNIFLSRQLVAERLSLLSESLPANVANPTITPLTSSASSLLGIGITSATKDLMEQLEIVEQQIIPLLMETKGVADVHVFGGQDRERQIRIRADDLFNTKLHFGALEEKLEKELTLLANGFSENNNQRSEIFLNSQPITLKQLKSLVIDSIDQRPIKVSDIASVEDSHAPLISTARINQTPGIFLMVQSQPFIDSLNVTRELEQKLAEIEPSLSISGITLHYDLFRPANFINEALSNIQKDVLIGAFLVLIVLLLFLFNARCALISAIAIPLSLLSSIIILVSQGLTLNIMVLGGLVIALGEVVDDAIIDTENIFRRLRENKKKENPESSFNVIVNASMEVRHSIIYATLIVIIAFSPLLFLPGIAGRLFEPLGLAYIYALGASLLVALTITPALCAILLSKEKSLDTKDSPIVLILKQKYLRLIHKIQRYPSAISLFVIFFVSLGLAIIPLFKMEFIPELREGHYTMHMAGVPGTSHVEVNRVGKLITEKINSIENVKSVVQWVGRAENGADTFGMNYSEIQIEVGPLSGEDQENTLEKIKATLTTLPGFEGASVPGFTFGIHTFLAERIEETASGYVADFVIEVVGLELEKINTDAKKITDILTSIPGARDVQMVTPTGIPQIKIDILWDRMAAFGIAPDEINRVITAIFRGIHLGELVIEENKIPVVLTFSGNMKNSINELKQLPLRSKHGQAFKLGDVTNIYFDTGKSKILRSGGKRIQAITANIEGRDIFNFEKEVKAFIDKEITFFPGNYYTVLGSATESGQSISTLIRNAIIALFFVILILRVALNSNVNLLIVLANLPFCLIGGIVAIVFTGGWLSIGSLVGFVTLFGITIRNSIMLTSHYQHLVKIENLPWNFATAALGASQRLPSILMT
ncbi:MAG: efflux RND transporter permease subunit, partial [Burkholderiaceae bacterium]